MRVVEGNLLDLAEGLMPPFSDLLYKMERRGVYVSYDELARIASEAERDRVDAAKALDDFAGTEKNWNANTTDVAWFLYDHLGLPEMPDDARSPKAWGKERITAHEALEWCHRHHPERRPELDTLRKYRRACRAKNYATDLATRAKPCTQYPGLGLVHPCYGTYNDNSQGKQRDKTGTKTGRLSISNPPLQQIPRDKKKDPYRVRRAFVAPPGKRLVVVDMEQLEVRIAAHIHIALFGDTTLRDLCTGGDFHGLVAYDHFSKLEPDAVPWNTFGPGGMKEHESPEVRWYREAIKTVFYGLAYLRGARTFGNVIWDHNGNPIGEARGQEFVNGIFTKIPAIPLFHDWVRQQVRDRAGMWDLFGVWRPVRRDNQGVRQAANQPLQGSGARLVMLWMLLLEMYDLTLQVHDETHAIVDEDEADDAVTAFEAAAEEVGSVMGLKCPLKGKGSHGDSWEAAK